MRKYKLLRFGRTYINQTGDLVIRLLYGDKKHGYFFAADFKHPGIVFGSLQIKSRIVPNDGSWMETNSKNINVASALNIREVANPRYKSERSQLFDGDWMRVGEVIATLN